MMQNEVLIKNYYFFPQKYVALRLAQNLKFAITHYLRITILGFQDSSDSKKGRILKLCDYL